MVARPSLTQRVFRLLLKLFPAEFRVAHEKSMEQAFRDEVREAGEAESRWSWVRLWGVTFWGTVTTAPGEHLRIFASDARYALRRFRHHLSMTAIAVLTIAVGIGATSAVFSIVHQVLLRPLPYDEPERLVHLKPLLHGEESVSGPVYYDLLSETQAFSGLFAMTGLGSVKISGVEGAERVRRLIVSPNYFDVLGVQPQLGRSFRAEDQLFLSAADIQGADPDALPIGPVVISHDLWQRRYGSDPEALGSLLRIADRPYEIVGILPPDFRVLVPQLMNLDAKRDLWYLSSWDPRTFPRDVHYMEVLGRLADGVTLDQARDEIDAFAARQRERHESTRQINYQMTVEPLHAQVVEGASRPLWLLFGAVALVLLIACSNVASLMVAGGATRQGELGMRLALGASRERLVRQLLTESFLIASFGAVLGLALATVSLELVLSWRPEALQRFEAVRLDRPVLLFTVVATTLSALMFGLIPSLRYSRPQLEQALQAGRRSLGGLLRSRRRGLLVAGEIALSFVLMAGTGLLLQTYLTQSKLDPGFIPERVSAISLEIPYRKVPKVEDRVALYRLMTETVAAIPGLESVGLTSSIPLDQSGGHAPIASDLAGAEEEQVWEVRVAPGYFRTLGYRMLAGRYPEWSDFADPDRPFALVDEALARRVWGDQAAVGKRLRLSRLAFGSNGSVPNEQVWAEVIGVVGTVYDESLLYPGPETAYIGLDFKISTQPILTFKARDEQLAGHPGGIDARVREVLRTLDDEIALSPTTSVAEVMGEMTASLRFTLSLLAVFANRFHRSLGGRSLRATFGFRASRDR